MQDGDQVLTERGAICVHLADRYAMCRLAPAIDDPRRPDYLRWMFYAIGVMEPLMAFALLKVEPKAPPGALAWGEWDTMFGVLTEGVSRGPFLLGDQFTAADVMTASSSSAGAWPSASSRRTARSPISQPCLPAPLLGADAGSRRDAVIRSGDYHPPVSSQRSTWSRRSAPQKGSSSTKM